MSRLLLTLAMLSGGLLAGCDGKDSGDTSSGDDTAAVDSDGDGVPDAEDCDPYNDEVYPGAPEAEDFADNDCDGLYDEGTDRYDDDGDGYNDYGGDCDDGDETVSPGAAEVPYDGVDQDCDNKDLTDVDGDSFDGEAAGGDDCDDTLAGVNPGASEWANEVDDNCDGQIDEGTDAYDDDGDGYSEAEGDCDDADSAVKPGATEIAYDGVDNDCDFYDLRDADGDGYDALEAGGADCDDAEATTHPEASEIPYDSIDQDCDGEDLVDVDGDGWLPGEGDCDDYEPDANPDMDEEPDYIDNDCDDDVDEETAFGDDDGDGYSEAEGDCDDENSGQYPDAPELVDGFDNDCNDLVDEINLDGAVAITGERTASYFGYSIDAGDFNGDGVADLAVSARYDDDASNNAGQAWVVSGDTEGGSISDVAMFSVTGAQSNTSLGTTVKFVPDMDGDGDDELLVAAPNDYITSSFRNEGIAYLLAGGPEGTYGLQDPVRSVASDFLRGGNSNEYSPDDIAAGDWSGDGFGDFALGNDSYEILATNQGGVFVFDGSVGPGAFGTASVPDAADTVIIGEGSSDLLGNRLEGVPDLDGDGYDELLVKASNESSAYLFDGDAFFTSSGFNASEATAKFRDSVGGSGWAAALTAGDFDGDGDVDVAVTNYNGTGSVAFFDNGGAGWSGAINVDAADAVVYGNYDQLGYSAASGDVDGDGRDEVLAGAYNFAEVELNAGAVFLFDAEDLATLDGTTHTDYGRPAIAEESNLSWGYSAVAADGWWAGGSYGSTGSNTGAVYLVPFEE